MRSSALEWAASTTCSPRSAAHGPAALSPGFFLLTYQGLTNQLPFWLVRLPPVATTEPPARQVCGKRLKDVVTQASCLPDSTWEYVLKVGLDPCAVRHLPLAQVPTSRLCMWQAEGQPPSS